MFLAGGTGYFPVTKSGIAYLNRLRRWIRVAPRSKSLRAVTMAAPQNSSFRDYPEAVALRALGYINHRTELDEFLARSGLDGELR